MSIEVATDLFGNPVAVKKFVKGRSQGYKTNPCISVYGKGPEGTRCKNCVNFFKKYVGKTFFKCELRGDTGGPGTDHRANWPTCGKYKEVEK